MKYSTNTVPIHSKLPDVGTTIFTVISQMAQQSGAINLGQGFPDFDGPLLLRERLQFHVEQGHNQYAPMAGVQALREQIAVKTKTQTGLEVCADNEVTVLPGATEAIYCAIVACVRTGDEVIVFDPAYDSYAPSVHLCGGKTIHIPLRPPEFGIDWQQVRDAINSKTRMIIINSPHNPTGALLTPQDLESLAELTRDSNIMLLSDEVYEYLVYDGNTHHSMLSHAELAQRAFVVSSFGKTYHVTGWKTGYCIAPAALTAELRKVHQYVTFVANTPVQHALADFMAACPEHCTALPAFYQAKRDLFCGAMRASRFEFTPTKGSFFQLMNYATISDKQDMQMAEWLTKAVKVAAVPISVFYHSEFNETYVRFCFAKNDETLLEAASRLSAL